MNHYDLVFVGHESIYEIDGPEGGARGLQGGAASFGALAAVWSKNKIAVITRMAQEDAPLLNFLKTEGIDVYIQPVAATTHLRIAQSTGNFDERLIVQTRNAGFFESADVPPMEPCWIHLAALTGREFSLGLMQNLKRRGFRLSVDMQGFVRHVHAETGIIEFKDVPAKREILNLAEIVKVDIVEAEVLTGTRDMEEAAKRLEGWGALETILTCSDGALARHKGETHFERFSNRSSQGRTGRGDTTIGAYLAMRMDHAVEDSLAFAVALASIKMETPGPFRGRLEDVLSRMKESS